MPPEAKEDCLPKVMLDKLREAAGRILSDFRSYYFFAALVVFYLISGRASQMRPWGVLGHIGVLILLAGAILLESKRQALQKELAQAHAENAELQAQAKEMETVLLNQRLQMATERLQPVVDEIQRRILAAFPDYTVSFAVAENNGYVYPDELVLTVKTPAGENPGPDEFQQVLALARDSAKELKPELAIHWA